MRIYKYLGLLLPVILTCAGADIVKNGKPCADIVISHDADQEIRQAARDLQKFLQIMSGAKLDIVTPDKVRQTAAICVGESRASSRAGYKRPAFKTSGYDIWVKGNCIVLNGPVTKYTQAPVVGKLHPVSRGRTLLSDDPAEKTAGISLADDCGPRHAVSAFLERLGVRFYAPYKEGTVVPELKDIRVEDFRETKEAAFARREYLMGKDQSADPELVSWFKRLKSGSSLPPVGVLSLADILKDGEKSHPEWAARNSAGEKLLTSDGCIFPRFPEKSLQKAVAAAAGKYFSTYPHIRKLLIVPPVLRGSADAGDYSRANPKNRYPISVTCNILAGFYTAVAEETAKSHPDKKIIWQGDHNRYIPDDRTEFPANMEAVPHALSPLSYAEPGSAKRYLLQTPQMAQNFKVNNMQQREWWNEFSVPQTARQPFFFPKTLQQIRKMQKGMFSGFVIEAGMDAGTRRLAEVPLVHFMHYVNCKLLWDPDLDLTALTDEYCRLWFGPAAAEMKNLIFYSEHMARLGKRSLSGSQGTMTQKDIDTLFEILEKAEKKTAVNSVYHRRVAAVKKSLSGLKGIFSRLTPGGKTLTAEVIPWNSACDLKFEKYKNWYSLPRGENGVRTEYSIAFNENRKRLMLAFRCYEPEMKKLRSPAEMHDDERIFDGDHIRVDFNTPAGGIFVFAGDSSGHFLDGSSDSAVLASTGRMMGKNGFSSRTAVRRYADRWETEFSIDIGGCGSAPDWDPPWALNISRIRTVSGKRETFALADHAELQPVKWRQLTVPKVDSLGRKINQMHQIEICFVPESSVASVYTVKRAKNKVSLAEPWDGKSWKDIPEIHLGFELWAFGSSSGFRPDARAKIQYDDKYIYALYQVRDRNVRGSFKQDQDMVCLDSCMELFIRPDRKGPYYNFECNCVGTLLLYEIHFQDGKRQMNPVDAAELKTIKRFFTLPRDLKGELPGPITWRLGLQIPIDFFVKRTGVSPELSGQVWTANVFKCADWTSTPSWLMWTPSYTFHNPDGFGTFIFE